jgi:hypothetical protein
MIVLAYLVSQCTKLHAAGWMCWFFTSCYLESCIWPDVTSRRIRSLWTGATETLAMLGKHSGKKAWAILRCLNDISKLTETENGETAEHQTQQHAHHFTWQQGGCSQRIRRELEKGDKSDTSVSIFSALNYSPTASFSTYDFETHIYSTLTPWPESTSELAYLYIRLQIMVCESLELIFFLKPRPKVKFWGLRFMLKSLKCADWIQVVWKWY